MSDHAETARQFLALHTSERPLLIPNPWDPGSARLLAWMGFKALATTSGGFAASLGRLDGNVSREEAVAHAAAVGEASGLPAFELGGGVKLRGRIDRIDVGAGGEAVVYDYKTSQAPPSARWIRDGNLQVALYMRAVEQLLGLRAIGGFYQPLSGTDLRARGVLDGDSEIGLACMDADVREHSEVQELLAEAVMAACQVAEQAGRGELEARPQTCAFRGGCMYPTICRCER